MTIFYYKSPLGNFGDDLNPWLWKRLLGDLDQYREDLQFVGIGSIIDKRLNTSKHKVIFGSGIRNYNTDFNLRNCDIRFVRGPLSSLALKNVPFITDSAYCIKLLSKKFDFPKRYRCSIIPYFRHVDKLNWNLIEELTGLHFIDVTQGVENVIEEISKSESVIAGAMHGAIVADCLRVPWIRLRYGVHGYESIETSNLKWKDWILSMEVQASNIIDIPIGENKLNKFRKAIFYSKTILKFLNNNNFYLSADNVMEKKLEQLELSIESFKMDYVK